MFAIIIMGNLNDCIRTAFAIDNDGKKGRAGKNHQSLKLQKCSSDSTTVPEENKCVRDMLITKQRSNAHSRQRMRFVPSKLR